MSCYHILPPRRSSDRSSFSVFSHIYPSVSRSRILLHARIPRTVPSPTSWRSFAFTPFLSTSCYDDLVILLLLLLRLLVAAYGISSTYAIHVRAFRGRFDSAEFEIHARGFHHSLPIIPPEIEHSRTALIPGMTDPISRSVAHVSGLLAGLRAVTAFVILRFSALGHEHVVGRWPAALSQLP